jgi:hypothetical protein
MVLSAALESAVSVSVRWRIMVRFLESENQAGKNSCHSERSEESHWITTY